MMPLFYIKAEYDHPNLNTIPQLTEVEALMKKIVENILNSTKQFLRWKDGSCQFCDSKGNNEDN